MTVRSRTETIIRGWTNLTSHVINQHPDKYESLLAAKKITRRLPELSEIFDYILRKRTIFMAS